MNSLNRFSLSHFRLSFAFNLFAVLSDFYHSLGNEFKWIILNESFLLLLIFDYAHTPQHFGSSLSGWSPFAVQLRHLGSYLKLVVVHSHSCGSESLWKLFQIVYPNYSTFQFISIPPFPYLASRFQFEKSANELKWIQPLLATHTHWSPLYFQRLSTELI